MYQPWLDQLNKIHIALLLEDAANTCPNRGAGAGERADRKARAAAPKPTGRRMALVLAAAAPVAVWIVWTWVAH